jgi:homoserine O-acetyltransferase
MMDRHNVSRGRGGLKKALSVVKARTLVVSMQGDLLFPSEEQKFLAAHIPNGFWAEVQTRYGHDGFLTESDRLIELFKDFLEQGEVSSELAKQN